MRATVHADLKAGKLHMVPRAPCLAKSVTGVNGLVVLTEYLKVVCN